MLSNLQAEAKAASESQLRRAEEEARKAAQLKLASAQARPAPSALARGQPGVRVRTSCREHRVYICCPVSTHVAESSHCSNAN